MSTALYPWQQASWQQLQDIRARLPHALLLHGPAGIGKARFAEYFARSLLCETPAANGHPCGSCASCGWVEQYSHPDYRRVRPEVLDDDEGSAGDGEEADEPKKIAKSAKAPSKDIRIEQVRALSDFMNISTHRQGLRVIVLYPAEALNGASANALLKTLEEPPPGTVILMVTNSLDRLLPTILSRCRKLALPLPSHDEALAWLVAQGVPDGDMWLAEQGGAPLAALEQSQAASREAINEFLAYLARPGVEAALKTAERLAKSPPAELVSWLQRWLHDLALQQLAGRIRYYPRYHKELAALAGRVSTTNLLQALKAANERRAIAEHPLSPKLFIEDMLLEYAALFS